MTYPLINGAVINGAEESSTEGIELVSAGPGTIFAVSIGAGASVLEFGAVVGENGVDIAATPSSLDLVRGGLGVISMAQPDPNVTLLGAGARPLEFGTPSVAGTVTLTGAGAEPLQLGVPMAAAVLLGQGASLMELGEPGPAAVMLRGASAWVLELGAPSAATFAGVSGIDLVSAGLGRVAGDAASLQGVSAYALELGDIGNPATITRGRSASPMQLGQPAISRGATC